MRTLTPVVAAALGGCGLVIPVGLFLLSVGLREAPRSRPPAVQEAAAAPAAESPEGVARAGSRSFSSP